MTKHAQLCGTRRQVLGQKCGYRKNKDGSRLAAAKSPLVKPCSVQAGFGFSVTASAILSDGNHTGLESQSSG